MKVWRLAKRRHAGTVAEMLSGEGARLHGGRWSPPGMRAVYCAQTSSLAVLEVLVHLADPADFVAHRILDLEVPDDLLVEPQGSMSDQPALGAETLANSVAMIVPSAVNRLERTVILNPAHHDFAQVVVGGIQQFVLDPRLRQQGQVERQSSRKP